MATASFRFYAGLNDFLPPPRRQQSFEADGPPGASVKNRIEALGVPHPEVALILVDGEPAGFDRLLMGGERVAVYPPFVAPAFEGALDLRPPLPAPLRFIADAHLGGLARLLRMAGFDTLYRNDLPDAEIATTAAAEARVVLTRDRALLMRREITHGAWLRAKQPHAQLAEVAARYPLAAALQPFSRCMICNTPLVMVEKAAVEPRLPPAVRARHTRFSACGGCGRVYWEGSHWRRMWVIVEGLAGR